MPIKVYDFNSSGRSHKSIGIDEVVQDAIDREVDTISVISSGNYINTILSEIERRGYENRISVVNLINGKPRGDLEIYIGGNRILRDAKEREEFVRESRLDLGNVADYTDFQPRAYLSECENILQGNPDYVSLGVGSGKLFLALRNMIEAKGLKTRLIGVLPKGENGVYNDENLFEDEQGNLYFRRFRPRSPADKLTPFGRSYN